MHGGQRSFVASLIFIALVVATVGSLGAPLITEVATHYHVALSSAQWTLTGPLLVGAIATPVLGRMGAGPHRRNVIVGTLAVVVAGSVLTVLPLGFGWLLAGRSAQGMGFGLTALMMGVARDAIPGAKSASTIAVLSVTSTVGVGVGYPLSGLLTEVANVRAAYGMGLLITSLALLTAWRAIPAAPEGRSSSVDLIGAALLGAGLLALVLVISQRSIWTAQPLLAGGLLALAAVLLTGWVRWERRTAVPLVDLGLLRHRAVAGANITMFFAAIGMYLLLNLVTRYVQTPESAGYGFGLTVFVAGLALVPFSVLGFFGGRVIPALRHRVSAPTVLAGGGAVVLLAMLFFAVSRSMLWEPFAVLGLLGLGVGVFSAAMPAAILAVTPKSETPSAMGVNQVVRSVGYSLGSALAGLLLSAFSTAGTDFPSDAGYRVSALIGVGIMAVTIVITFPVRRSADVIGEPGEHGVTVGRRKSRA